MPYRYICKTNFSNDFFYFNQFLLKQIFHPIFTDFLLQILLYNFDIPNKTENSLQKNFCQVHSDSVFTSFNIFLRHTYWDILVKYSTCRNRILYTGPWWFRFSSFLYNSYIPAKICQKWYFYPILRDSGFTGFTA